jgi:hypothetical protein
MMRRARAPALPAQSPEEPGPSDRSRPSVSWTPLATRLLAAALALVVFGWVAAAPADDPIIPEKYIKVDELKALLDRKRRLWLIDVRPAEQYDSVHIRGAFSIPLNELKDRLGEVPQIVPVVLY